MFALLVAPQGLDALPRISGPLAFGSLVSFVPRITLVTIADTIKAPCSRHPVKRVCATLAVLRLVLLRRRHRIMTVKSFAVLLIQQAFALTISLSASRILACRFAPCPPLRQNSADDDGYSPKRLRFARRTGAHSLHDTSSGVFTRLVDTEKEIV